MNREQNDFQTKIHIGDMVRLDKKSIMDSPDWKRKELKYRVWCLEHFDEEFTVESYKESRPDLWQLKEDDSRPKWLFHASELLITKENPIL